MGTSGSGKTTLGREITSRLSLPHTDLDDHYWLPNWIPRDKNEFQKINTDKFNEDQWVITGNYSRLAGEMWPKADMVVWLDLPLRVLLWRGFKRSLKLTLNQETTCKGNKESFSRLFGRKSILGWFLMGYKRRKKTNTLYFEQQKKSSQKLVHLKSSKEVASFLTTFL